MPHFPKPYFRSQRETWCVQIDGKQLPLGPDREAAFREYRRLMAERDNRASAPVAAVAVVTVLDAFLDWLSHRVAEGTKAERTYDWYRAYL